MTEQEIAQDRNCHYDLQCSIIALLSTAHDWSFYARFARRIPVLDRHQPGFSARHADSLLTPAKELTLMDFDYARRGYPT
jgi:hypothetical protein